MRRRFESLKRPKVLMHTWLAWLKTDRANLMGRQLQRVIWMPACPTGAVIADGSKRVFFGLRVFWAGVDV